MPLSGQTEPQPLGISDEMRRFCRIANLWYLYDAYFTSKGLGTFSSSQADERMKDPHSFVAQEVNFSCFGESEDIKLLCCVLLQGRCSCVSNVFLFYGRNRLTFVTFNFLGTCSWLLIFWGCFA